MKELINKLRDLRSKSYYWHFTEYAYRLKVLAVLAEAVASGDLNIGEFVSRIIGPSFAECENFRLE